MNSEALVQLAKLRNKMGLEEHTNNVSEQAAIDKKLYGRIFQADHVSLRLAQRNLEIPRDVIRPHLINLDRTKGAVLYHIDTRTFMPMISKGKKDWMVVTVYNVNNQDTAERKAKKKGQQIISF